MSPTTASSLLINAYVAQLEKKIGWDFEDESPGRDARGYAREGSMPPEIETHLVNAVLTNGARYYVDHAHPEYSTPECSNASRGRAARPRRRADLEAVDGGRQPSPRSGRGDRHLQEQFRRQGQLLRLPRELPHRQSRALFAHRPRAHPTPCHAADLRRGGQDRRRGLPRGLLAAVPAQPAGRLLRGGSGPRDDAKAPDHQHPRRAPRRPAEVPPPARDQSGTPTCPKWPRF